MINNLNWLARVRKMRIALVILLTMFVMGTPGRAVAGAQEDAAAAYERKDYTTLRPLAEQGHPDSQFSLGRMYANGHGVPQDHAQAILWFRKAAEQSNASAQYNLGRLYEGGRGVGQSYSEAVQWYRKAADQGNASAQYYLGAIYYDGRGVRQNYAEASQWFRKAADQGEAAAQYVVGFMYKDGQGVRQDYLVAHVWLSLATPALGGGLDEHAVRAASYLRWLTIRLTPAQLAEAQRLAQEWKPTRGGK